MFTVYSKPDCGYCVRAKDLIETLGEDFISKDITEETNYNELLQRNPSARTLPQIWLNDNYIGGYTELVKSVG